jgi:ketosteroid isomerase-like protein
MPEETEFLARNIITAFNREGIDAALEYADPQIEWIAPPEWLEDRLYEGHEGVRRLALFWMTQFDQYRLELEEFIHLGEGRGIVLLLQRGRIRASDVPIEQPVGWIVESRDGKVARVEVYFSWEAARAAAGPPAEPA